MAQEDGEKVGGIAGNYDRGSRSYQIRDIAMHDLGIGTIDMKSVYGDCCLIYMPDTHFAENKSWNKSRFSISYGVKYRQICQIYRV